MSPVNVQIALTLNPEALQQIKGAIFAGVQEVFELDIKPEAVELSPKRTGTNARSIDTEVTQEGATGNVNARLFTQSGYGGYLELGTRKMAAQPYLYPAFQQFANSIVEACRRHMLDEVPPGAAND